MMPLHVLDAIVSQLFSATPVAQHAAIVTPSLAPRAQSAFRAFLQHHHAKINLKLSTPHSSLINLSRSTKARPCTKSTLSTSMRTYKDHLARSPSQSRLQSRLGHHQFYVLQNCSTPHRLHRQHQHRVPLHGISLFKPLIVATIARPAESYLTKLTDRWSPLLRHLLNRPRTFQNLHLELLMQKAPRKPFTKCPLTSSTTPSTTRATRSTLSLLSRATRCTAS